MLFGDDWDEPVFGEANEMRDGFLWAAIGAAFVMGAIFAFIRYVL